MRSIKEPPSKLSPVFDGLRPNGFYIRNPFVLSLSKHDNRLAQSFSRYCLRGLLIVSVFALTGCAEFRARLASEPQARKSSASTAVAPKLVKIEPPVSAESRQLYERALAALKARKYVEAERGLLAVVHREPDLAGPYANLGIVYAHTARPKQAIEALQQAIKLNGERAAYHNELGVLLRREGKFDDARRAYSDALDADPTYAYAHLNIAILYDLYLQDADRALLHYQRYRELMPSETGAVAKWIADLQQRSRAAERSKGGTSG